MSFQCPDCKRVSHNPNDERERYCGACNKFFPKQSALDRIKELDAVITPSAEALWIKREDVRKLLAVVEAAESMNVFCEDPMVTITGLVPCNECPKCKLRICVSALHES